MFVTGKNDTKKQKKHKKICKMTLNLEKEGGTDVNSKKRSKYAYLYLAPFFIVFLIFNLFPILYSFVLSFCDMDVLSGDLTFIGWDNYERMIESGYFFQSIGNTLLIWIMSIIPQLTIAFLLALILSNKWFRGRFILRNIYYFPNLVTPVTIGLLFGAMFSYPGGAINNIISALGLEAVDFQNNQMLARMVIAIAICWKNFGFNIIYFTAGINSISNEVLEAAGLLEIEGIAAEILKLNTIQPLDIDAIEASVRKTNALLVLEECVEGGCVGQRIASMLSQRGCIPEHLILKNLGAAFTAQGSVALLRQSMGLNGAGIAATVKEALHHGKETS